MIDSTRLPELGPWLGRLCAPPAPSAMDLVRLDEVRLSLATATLDLAGAARDFADGDRAAAVSALRARDWREAWERAVGDAAERTKATIDRAFADAAGESRFPARGLARLRVNAHEREAIAARLGAGGLAFESALARLDELAGPASHVGGAGEAAFASWWDGVTEAARRLDTAWSSLALTARQEVERWQPGVELVRRWRRPRWPIWTVNAATLALAVWLGLVLGGYLPVPAWLQPFAEWWWTRVTFA